MSNKKLALTQLLADQLVGHHVGPQPPEKYDKPTNIIVARNGIFRVVKTDVAIFKTQIAKMENDYVVPGVEAMEEGVELLIPKIPFKYWLQVLQFYRDVYDKDGTEASVLFFWNTYDVELPTHYGPTEAQRKLGQTQGDPIKGLVVDGKLIVYCPRQKNSSGLSEFGHDGMVNWLRENTTPLLETHSHHVMNAFFSSTDDANENMNQFYAVYGKIKDEKPAFVFRFCSGKHKVQCSPSVLFDFPQVKTTVITRKDFVGVEDLGIAIEETTEEEVKYEEYMGPWPKVEYPEDWMEQHTKNHYTYAKNYYGGYGGGYGGYSGYNAYGYNSQGAWGGAVPTGADTYKEEADNLNYDDYYDGYYGGSYYGSYYAKKKEKEGEVETETAIVQYQAEKIVNSMTHKQIKQLIFELSEYGYDYLIAEALEEQRYKGY